MEVGLSGIAPPALAVKLAECSWLIDHLRGKPMAFRVLWDLPRRGFGPLQPYILSIKQKF